MHQRGKPDCGLRRRAGAGGCRAARPAAQDPVVREQAGRRFEPAARGQRAALRRPLLAGRRLCADEDSLVVPGVKTAKLPDFAGRHPRRPAPPRPLGVLAPSQPYVYSPLTVVLGDEGARPQDRRHRRSRRASHRDRKRHARRRHPDDLRQGAADRQHHPSGSRARRSARRARPRRLRRDLARPAPLRRLSRRASRHARSPRPAIIIRSAPIAAMSGSPAIRR